MNVRKTPVVTAALLAVLAQVNSHVPSREPAEPFG